MTQEHASIYFYCGPYFMASIYFYCGPYFMASIYFYCGPYFMASIYFYCGPYFMASIYFYCGPYFMVIKHANVEIYFEFMKWGVYLTYDHCGGIWQCSPVSLQCSVSLIMDLPGTALQRLSAFQKSLLWKICKPQKVHIPVYSNLLYLTPVYSSIL